MEAKPVDGLTLYYDRGDERAAELVAGACTRSLELIPALWGLEAPVECRVYIMSAWRPFLSHSAPGLWRIYLALTLPLRRTRFEKTWDMAGAWALRYGRRRIIGVKPPRLLQDARSGLGERFYVRRDPEEAMQHNTCHELVHACSDGLRLPTWLNEGLAMVTVDRLAGKPTVRAETLELLAGRLPGATPPDGQSWFSVDREGLLYLAARSYWITRYLAEAHPELLRRQLAERRPRAALESALANGLGLAREEFWQHVDGMVVRHVAATA